MARIIGENCGMATERNVPQCARRRAVALARAQSSVDRCGGLIAGRAAPPLVTATKRPNQRRPEAGLTALAVTEPTGGVAG